MRFIALFEQINQKIAMSSAFGCSKTHFVMKLSQTCMLRAGISHKITHSRYKGYTHKHDIHITHTHGDINDPIVFFRSNGVLFDSTVAEMDAACRARYHIGIIGL